MTMYQSEGFGSVERLAKILANSLSHDCHCGRWWGSERCHQWHYAIRCRRQRTSPSAWFRTVSEMTSPNIGDLVPNTSGCQLYHQSSVEENRRRLLQLLRRKRTPAPLFLNAVNIGLGARDRQNHRSDKRFWGVEVPFIRCLMFSLIFERKLYRMHLRINDEHIRGRIMTVCIGGSAWGWGQTPVPFHTTDSWILSVILPPGNSDADSGRILNHKISEKLPDEKK